MNIFKPGDKARVIGNESLHNLENGTEVEIFEYFPKTSRYKEHYKVKRDGRWRLASPCDLEPIEPVQEEKQGNRPELNMKKEQFKMVAELLGVNGFKQSEEYSVSNYLCEVKMMDNCFAVYNNSGDAMFSPNLEIYWLIGVLTYYGYMDKNYKQ